MFFIACFFRSMCGKDQSFLYFCNILIVFLVEIKGRADAMCFIQMIKFGLKIQLIHQFGTANPEQDKLRHFGSQIGIIQTMTDGLGNIIIFSEDPYLAGKAVPR